MDLTEIVAELQYSINIIKDKHRKMLNKVTSIVFSIVFVIEMIFFTVKLDITEPYIIVGVIGIFIMLMVVLISFSINGQDLRNQMINQVIKYYNYEQSASFLFETKPKVSKDFNQEMGLFTRGASVRTNYIISGKLPSGYSFQILDCQLVTSNGKSSTVHFAGIYMIFKVPSDDVFQIRTRFKPRLKDTKFKRLEKYPEKVFIPIDGIKDYIDDKYISLYRKVFRTVNCRNLYLASNRKEMHLAISLTHPFKVIKNIDETTFKQYYDRYISLVNMAINEFENINNI